MTSLLRELLHHLHAPTLYNQNFGLVLDLIPDSQLVSTLSPLRSLVQCTSSVSGNHEFQVSLDVQQFEPEELSVNVKGDSVVVEGKHEEKKDQHGFISRQFIRRYQLPENVDSNSLQASLSSDGVLQLTAASLRSVEEVDIPIIRTKGTAAALLNGSCETGTVVNGDSKTATVNGDSMKHRVSPTSSPSQPTSKKPRIEVGN